MHVPGVGDSRVVHRRRDGVGDEFDLFAPSEVLIGEVGGAGAAERQRAPLGRPLDVPAFEHYDMRRKRPFRAPRHHDAHRIGLFGRQVAPQQVFQRAQREAARKIVDAAVALGLAEDRHQTRRPDRPRGDHRLQGRSVVGPPRRNPVDERLAGHGRPAMNVVESLTAPNTPPCILTILTAAR